MKHMWVDHYTGVLSDDIFKRRRKCTNCGAIQERTTEYTWMRVTGYRWGPPAGQCKLKAQGSNTR